MAKQILTLHDIKQLQKEIQINEPASPYFDCGSYEEDAPLIQTSMPPFRSMFYQIGLYTQGCIHLQVNEKLYILPPNTLFMCAPGTVLSYTIQEKLKGYYLLFSPGYLAPSLLKSEGIHDFVFFSFGQYIVSSLDNHQVNHLSDTFQKVRQEKGQASRYSFDIINCYITLLILQSRRIFETQQAPNSGFQQPHIQKFQALITQHLQAMAKGESQGLKSVSDYAKELSIHPNYLNEIVRKELGRSASSHIQARIVLEALTLLRQTDLTVKEVAFKLGFQSVAHFSAFFKKRTFYTPSSYKQAFKL